MTSAQIASADLLQDLKGRLKATVDLPYFIEKATGGRWKRATHLDYLCNIIEDAIWRGSGRIIITLPPQHGKSEVVSRHLPAWYLGQYPDRKVIMTSYSASLIEDHSRAARSALKEVGPELFGITVARDSSAVGRWGIEDHQGGVTAVGIGGSITGRGADLAIIDDPFKGPEDSHSPTQRKRVVDWYKTVLRTRMAPGGTIILIQTRWHKADLAGFLMEDDSDVWNIINLPAVAVENDPIDRNVGEALWPERYPLEVLRSLERTLGPYWWHSVYQQTPGDPEGNLFKRRYFKQFSLAGDIYILHKEGEEQHVLKRECVIFQTCDPAASTKSSADWFVLSTWAITPNYDLLLIDVIRERLEGPDQPQLFLDGYMRWRPLIQGTESAGLGKILYQTLVRTGLPIVELEAVGDKTLRAIPMASRYKAGAVYHMAHAPWLDEWEEELAAFPNGPHDDQVDTASYAAITLASMDTYMSAYGGEEVVTTHSEEVIISPV